MIPSRRGLFRSGAGRSGFLLMLMLSAAPVRALWFTDPAENQPVAACPGRQESPALADDGAGGAIVVWEDTRNGGYDIYAQRFDATGAALWGSCGTAVIQHAGDQRFPVVAADGAGGVIIAWIDFRTGERDMHAQRMNAAGTRLWAVGGVRVYDDNGLHSVTLPVPAILPDGTGGAAFVFNYERVAVNGADIHIQRLNAGGGVLLTNNGVPVADTPADETGFAALRTAGGDVLVVYEDDSEGGGARDLYIQRITPLNVQALGSGGRGAPLAVGAADQRAPATADLGAGRYSVAWTDTSGDGGDIRILATDQNGTVAWGPFGGGTFAAIQKAHALTTNAAGDSLLAWEDARGGESQIYGERFTFGGARMWSAGSGTNLTTGTMVKSMPRILDNGASGGVVIWRQDDGVRDQLLFQNADAAGAPLLDELGAPLSVRPDRDADQHAAIRTGGGLVLAAWRDSRNGIPNYDIFGQCLDPAPPPSPTATSTPTPVATVTPSATATASPEPTIAPCCLGDANNSGSFVDAADFIAVQANFGADNGFGGLGDANCSGSFVDAADFIAVQANFGADCGSPPTPTATRTPTPTPTPMSTATSTAPPCCLGDANNSGSFVDAADFIAVQANFGADNGFGGLGDANCSGSFVDAADFIAVQANFGADCG